MDIKDSEEDNEGIQYFNILSITGWSVAADGMWYRGWLYCHRSIFKQENEL
jgi:hypothetical protein